MSTPRRGFALPSLDDLDDVVANDEVRSTWLEPSPEQTGSWGGGRGPGSPATVESTDLQVRPPRLRPTPGLHALRARAGDRLQSLGRARSDRDRSAS